MKFRVLFSVAALLAMTTMVFAQPGNTYFMYPGDWDCASHPPLTYKACFDDVAGVVIPNGTTITVFIKYVGTADFVVCWTFAMNADEICWPAEDGGYFTQWYPCMANNGDEFYLEVQFCEEIQGVTYCCTYTGPTYTMVGAPQPASFPLYEGDFTCTCDEWPPEEEYCDLGDLGAPYPTGAHPAGPCHLVSDIAWLGQIITAEPVPNLVDMDDFPPGDDGVVFDPPVPWLACTMVSVTVTVTAGGHYDGQELFLSGWKDGNLDGDFDDYLCQQPNGPAPEWIIQDMPVVPGVHTIRFMDPGMPTDVPYTGIFRFRLSSAPFGWQWWTGGHDGLGEVEDYYVEDLQLPVELTAAPLVGAGDRELTVSFAVGSEQDVNAYEIWRDGVKVTELAKANGSYSYVDRNLVNGRVYTYGIIAVGLNERKELSFDGKTVWSGSPSWLAATVTEYALHQNYPNPFNPTTEIVYDVVEPVRVTLKVYNVMGQEVATLVNGTVDAGRHAATFDATGLTSGLYFYTITMGDFSATKKMLLVQ